MVFIVESLYYLKEEGEGEVRPRISEKRTSEEPCRANLPVQACQFSAMVEITPGGVRVRVRRNTLEHDKDENGRLFVYADESLLVRIEAQDMSTDAFIDSLLITISKELVSDET